MTITKHIILPTNHDSATTENVFFFILTKYESTSLSYFPEN